MAGVGAASCVCAAFGQDARSDYSVYWGVVTSPGIAPADNAYHLNSSVVNRNCVFLFAYQAGRYPYAGPHIIHRTPGFMQQHLANLRVDLDLLVPDLNFSGPVVIDFEDWALNWERTRNEASTASWDSEDQDYLTDWEEYMRSVRSEVFVGLSAEAVQKVLQTTYEQAAMDYVVSTLMECRRLRPHAKFGIYNYPPKRYYSAEVPRRTPRIIGYGDHTHLGSQLNDKLWRLWDASVAIFPSTYSQRNTVPDGVTPNATLRQNTIAEESLYIQSNIEEAIRVARGKPVYNLAWTRYQNAGAYAQIPLTRINIGLQYSQSLAAGSHGLIWWDGIEFPYEYVEIDDWMVTSNLPELTAFWPTIPPPAPPPGGIGLRDGHDSSERQLAAVFDDMYGDAAQADRRRN